EEREGPALPPARPVEFPVDGREQFLGLDATAFHAPGYQGVPEPVAAKESRQSGVPAQHVAGSEDHHPAGEAAQLLEEEGLGADAVAVLQMHAEAADKATAAGGPLHDGFGNPPEPLAIPGGQPPAQEDDGAAQGPPGEVGSANDTTPPLTGTMP